jgi:hypothetical protein
MSGDTGRAATRPPSAADDRLGERVVETLQIMADRGYNPTIALLSEMMVGGRVDSKSLVARLPTMGGVLVEDGFVHLEGKGYVDACKRRVEAHGRLEALYRGVAEEYTKDLVRLCPWVRCVMLVGSAATGGLCEGDDLDLNIVVDDRRKFSTLLVGSMLNRKYALKYRSRLKYARSHHYMLPMFMCLNIVWEDREVRPFRRQDRQMAYELMSAKVLAGEDHFKGMLDANGWLRDIYPQMFERRGSGGEVQASRHARTAHPRSGPFEGLARRMMFGMERTVRIFLSRKPGVLERMDYWEGMKRPYGIYDLPEGGVGGP